MQFALHCCVRVQTGAMLGHPPTLTWRFLVSAPQARPTHGLLLHHHADCVQGDRNQVAMSAAQLAPAAAAAGVAASAAAAAAGVAAGAAAAAATLPPPLPLPDARHQLTLCSRSFPLQQVVVAEGCGNVGLPGCGHWVSREEKRSGRCVPTRALLSWRFANRPADGAAHHPTPRPTRIPPRCALTTATHSLLLSPSLCMKSDEHLEAV